MSNNKTSVSVDTVEELFNDITTRLDGILDKYHGLYVFFRFIEKENLKIKTYPEAIMYVNVASETATYDKNFRVNYGNFDIIVEYHIDLPKLKYSTQALYRQITHNLKDFLNYKENFLIKAETNMKFYENHIECEYFVIDVNHISHLEYETVKNPIISKPPYGYLKIYLNNSNNIFLQLFDVAKSDKEAIEKLKYLLKKYKRYDILLNILI